MLKKNNQSFAGKNKEGIQQASPGSDKSRKAVGKVVVVVTMGGVTWQNQTSVAHVKDALSFPIWLPYMSFPIWLHIGDMASHTWSGF